MAKAKLDGSKILISIGDEVIGECTGFTFDPDLNTNDLDTLESRIREAVEAEDYERADKIKKYIDNGFQA